MPARHGSFCANASSMPAMDAASSTAVPPSAATSDPDGPGRTEPEGSAPPPNRVFADPGASTPISNPVSDRAASPAAPTLASADPQSRQGQADDDGARRAGRSDLRCRGIRALVRPVTLPVAGRRAGDHRRVAAVGGPRVGVAAAVVAAAVSVTVAAAVVVVVRLLFLLRHLAEVRRHLVPGGTGEDRRGELLNAQPHELVLGIGVPDVGRPGTTETARDAAEAVQRLTLFFG